MLLPGRISVALFGMVVTSAVAFGQQPDSVPRPASALFSSHDLLYLTIEVPLGDVFRERGQESSYHDAVLRVGGDDGEVAEMEIGVKTRGKFRLQRSTCNFPPLRLNVRAQQAVNTIFEGEDKLKLVTHCRNGRSEYEQYVLKEYLAYRVFNLLTDLSFRVRLAHITYIDAKDDPDTTTAFGFLIEDEDAMAARNGWIVLDVPQVPPFAYDRMQLSLVEVFQYLVGNPDWDAFGRPPDEDYCCHNIKVIGDMAGPVFPIPYDFDFTGLVDARYATPDRSLNIQTVRQRVYRGVCRPREELDAAVQILAGRQAEIYSLINNQEGLEFDVLESTIEYLDEFFAIIGDADRVRRNMEGRCRSY